MCQACIGSTAVMVAGATGGLLAVCIAKFRNDLGPRPKTKEN
jgi:hypothetical protein